MKKKNLTKVMILFISIFIFNCSLIFADESNTDLNPVTTIEILHTNDTHGNISSDQGFGFDRIASLAKEEKEKNKNTLLIDAGDVFNGTSLVNLDKGETAIKVLEKAGYDFMTIGNADFSYGYDRITGLSQMVENPKVLSANIFKDGKRDFEPYNIVDMDGVKVGIFGLTTPIVSDESKGIEAKDPVETSKEMVTELKEHGADIIIAVSHIGEIKGDYSDSQEIVEQVDGIDLIVDGHSHTELANGLTVNNTLIVQTGSNNKNVGKVEIDVQNKKIIRKSAELLKAEDYTNLEKDKDVSELIDCAQKRSDAIYSDVVASTDIDLDGERSNVRTKETNLGDIVADAIRSGTNSDIGLVPSAAIRASIKAGNITKDNVAQLFAVGSQVNKVNATGKTIVKLLEKGIVSYPEENGMFFQVSGLTFCFDPSQDVGNRVFNVKVKGTDIELDKEYTVATDENISAALTGSSAHDGLGVYDDFFINYMNNNPIENSILKRISVRKKLASVGDVNNDNVVSLIDYIKLQSYLADNEIEINTENSDINGDTIINDDDLILLKQMLLE